MFYSRQYCNEYLLHSNYVLICRSSFLQSLSASIICLVSVVQIQFSTFYYKDAPSYLKAAPPHTALALPFFICTPSSPMSWSTSHPAPASHSTELFLPITSAYLYRQEPPPHSSLTGCRRQCWSPSVCSLSCRSACHQEYYNMKTSQQECKGIQTSHLEY